MKTLPKFTLAALVYLSVQTAACSAANKSKNESEDENERGNENEPNTESNGVWHYDLGSARVR